MKTRRIYIGIIPIFVSILVLASDSGTRGLLPSDVHSGMKGYGLSCFSGSEPERLDVEILGIMKNNPPGSFTYLGRVSGSAVDRGGIMSGMSGSPVFVNGRLIGAMAFAFPFAKEAICGITPIQDMDALWNTSISVDSRAGTPQLRSENVLHNPSQVWESCGVPIALPFCGTGISTTVVDELNSFAGIPKHSVFNASLLGSDQIVLARPVQGGPVGVALIDGDLKLAAMGTVTSIDDDRVLAFGHAMFTSGQCTLPMVAGEIVTIIPSLAQSFKIGNLGQIIGTVVRDLRAGIAGRLDLEPTMIPMSITFSDMTSSSQSFNVRLLSDDTLTSAYASIAAASVYSRCGPVSGDVALELTLTINFADREPFHIRKLVGESESPIATIHQFLETIRLIMINPIEPVSIRKMDVTISVREDVQVILLETANALTKTIRAGDSVKVRLDFRDYRRAVESRFVTIDVPAAALPGNYTVKIMDADTYRNWKASRNTELYFQPDLNTYLNTLADSEHRDELIVLLCRDSKALIQNKSTLPNLPPTLERAAVSSGLESAIRIQDTVLNRQTLSFPMQISGSRDIKLNVVRSLQ